MPGKEAIVKITSTMNVTQEEWDKIFGKKEEEREGELFKEAK